MVKTIPGKSGPVSISLLTYGTAATYTVPNGIFRLKVRLVGGGGGGGGADSAVGNVGVGGGGYSGGYAEKIYVTTPGATFTYTIGAGGAGGLAGNNSGTTGGNTLFDEAGSVVTAPGGPGGGSMAAGTTMNATGKPARVQATGGDLNLFTEGATRGWRLSSTQWIGSCGASGLLGNGGGGGGGQRVNSATDQAGGAGTIGLIIVEEYN